MAQGPVHCGGNRSSCLGTAKGFNNFLGAPPPTARQKHHRLSAHPLAPIVSSQSIAELTRSLTELLLAFWPYNMSFGGQTPTIIVLKEGQEPLHPLPSLLAPCRASHLKTDSQPHRNRYIPGKGPDYFQYQRLSSGPGDDQVYFGSLWRRSINGG